MTNAVNEDPSARAVNTELWANKPVAYKSIEYMGLLNRRRLRQPQSWPVFENEIG